MRTSLVRHTASIAIGLALLSSLERAAHADDGDACKEAYEQAQVLMTPKQGPSPLLPAREKLRACMRPGCKDGFVADCSKWLGEVEARIPSVVFAARNTAGRELTEISVTTSEGTELAPRLDGKAVEVEPGEHVFVFVHPDGTKREEKVVVRERDKAQRVATTFEAPPDEVQTAPPPPAPAAPAAPAGEPETPTLKYVGYGMGAAGIAGVAIGALFGINAISKKSEAHCDASNACDPKALDDARSAARVSTGAFVVGGLLLAGGITLVLLTPSSARQASPPTAKRNERLWLDARASVAPGAAGVVVGGRW